MSFTCQQCGTTATQPFNFCRRCGTPAPTIALSTLPLASQPAEFDPLKTWDPTKEVVGAAATEVLPVITAVAATRPVLMKVETLATGNLPVLAARPKRPGTLAAAAVGVLAIVSVLGYSLTPRPGVTANVAAAAVPVATVTPAPGMPEPAPPVEFVAAVPASTPASVTDTVSAKTQAKKQTARSNVRLVATAAPALPIFNPNSIPPLKTAAPAPAPEKTEDAESRPVKVALIEKGNRLLNAGQIEEAIHAYEKARRANPGNTDVYYLLGLAHHQAGNLTKALEAYRQCTSGNYAKVAANHVKNLEKKRGHSKPDPKPGKSTILRTLLGFAE
jgi:hypothetical protein